MLLASAVVVLAGSAAAWAQSVPVTVEVQGPEQPTEPTSPTSESPGDDPSTTDQTSPAPPSGREPAADPPPDEPLARTGADVLRTMRDAAALIAAGLVLLLATRNPERTAR